MTLLAPTCAMSAPSSKAASRYGWGGRLEELPYTQIFIAERQNIGVDGTWQSSVLFAEHPYTRERAALFQHI